MEIISYNGLRVKFFPFPILFKSTFSISDTLKFSKKDASIRPELVEVSKGHFVQLSRSSVKDFKKYAHLVDY